MFTLIRRDTWRDVLTGELPALLVSLGVAEVFFKFHSFMLEGAAFLALWYALGAVAWTIRARISRAVTRPGPAG